MSNRLAEEREELGKNLPILQQWEVSQALEYILDKELIRIKEDLIDATEETFRTLQGRAKALQDLLNLIIAPVNTGKQGGSHE